MVVKKLKDLFLSDISDEANRQLLSQNFASLSATYSVLRGGDSPGFQQNSELTEKIENLLNGEQTWDNAHQIEHLLVNLYEAERLEVVLINNLIETKDLLNKDVHAYLKKANSEVSTIVEKRAILHELMIKRQSKDALYTHYLIVAKRTMVRIGTVCFLAVILFLLPEVLPMPVKEFQSKYHTIAVRGGLLGASFSMLISLNRVIKNIFLQELETLSRYGFIATRAITGIGGR